jgi:2-C-methyl-D-erythritol 2,4-cyclodiphosphate synthase
MSESRIGFGLDIHPFVEVGDERFAGRQLVLGGVIFEGEPALVGHSDADALAHAIGDALLGAAGLGDLGEHFPPDDERYAGADSLELLRECVNAVRAEDWRVANVDCTILAERPRVRPHRGEMTERLGAVVGAPVNVKATTPEGLGALGRAEGVSCLAVVLLER